MGGVLQYKWEAYCRVSLSSKLRSHENTAIQMGGILPYKLEVYHPFQNRYTHKIITFKLFRSLQLQFSGPTGINFCYSYSFVGLTRIYFFTATVRYSYIKNVPWNHFPKITVTVT